MECDWEKMDTRKTLVEEAFKSVKEYRSALFSVCKMWWQGNITDSDFILLTSKIIVDHFYQAWKWGLRGTGGLETEEGLNTLQDIIDQEVSYVPSLLDKLKELKKVNKLRELSKTLTVWQNTYLSVRELARTIEAAPDTILRWEMGPTVEHCEDCLRYSNVEKPKSEWDELFKKGIYPKSRSLACNGYHCLCKLVVVKPEKSVKFNMLNKQSTWLRKFSKFYPMLERALLQTGNNVVTRSNIPELKQWLVDHFSYTGEWRNNPGILDEMLIEAAKITFCLDNSWVDHFIQDNELNLDKDFPLVDEKSVAVKSKWWLLPNGSLEQFSGIHEYYVLENPEKFGLSREQFGPRPDQEPASLALSKGAIRITNEYGSTYFGVESMTPGILRKIQSVAAQIHHKKEIIIADQNRFYAVVTLEDLYDANSPQDLLKASKGSSMANGWGSEINGVENAESEENEQFTFRIPVRKAENKPGSAKISLI